MRPARLIPPALLLLAAASLTGLALRRPPAPAALPAGAPPGRVRVEPRGDVVRVVETREPVMGTVFGVEVAAPDEASGRAACSAAFAEVARLEGLHSRWIPGSLLSRINREAAARPVPLDPDTLAVLRVAAGVWRRSDGAFDPTVGPLLALWKPLAALPAPPSAAEIRDALERVGFDAVEIDERAPSIRYRRAGMALDLGGVAKGYAADRAAAAALAAGARCCRVNAGGDLVLCGTPPWSPAGFDVALRDPAGSPGDALPGGAFLLTDRGVATSGNYERYTEIDGTRYSHILDPRTGRPVPDAVAQVTVIARDGAAADALATALAVLGVERGLALAESLPDVEACFLTRREPGFDRHATAGFPGGPR